MVADNNMNGSIVPSSGSLSGWTRPVTLPALWLAMVGIGVSCSTEDQENDVEVAFFDLRAEDVTSSRAVVRFDTSVQTTCELEYGFEQDQLSLSAVDPDMDPDNPYAIEHEVPVEDLPPLTRVYYRARATTRDGATFYSEITSFDTLADEPSENHTDQMLNVALLSAGSSIVEVSSNFGGATNSGTWGVDAAFDGKMSTEWSTDGDGNNAVVAIDLGRPRTLRVVAYRSRQMNDGSSIVGSYQLVLDDGTILGPFATPNPDLRYEFILKQPVITRSVRFEAVETTGGNTGAKEIQFFVDRDE